MLDEAGLSELEWIALTLCSDSPEIMQMGETWVVTACPWCWAWVVTMHFPAGTYAEGVLEAATRVCDEAAAEHVVECRPDLAVRTDVERWLDA